MDFLLAAVAGLVVGALVGALVVGRPPRTRRPPDPTRTRPAAPPPALAAAVLEALHVGVAVLDASDEVVLANPTARSMAVVRGSRLVVGELRRLAQRTRRDRTPRDVEVDLRRARVGREPAAVRARLSLLPNPQQDLVLLLVEDVTEARRVEEVRRDFVANVSHELKTPVGALALLAETITQACDDPVTVRRFAGRLQQESGRLSRLVQELIDLSRLQGGDPLPDPKPVAVDAVVREAAERTRLVAQARSIDVVTGGESGLRVPGSEIQLVTALANLLDNAVAYSPPHTRVAVSVRRTDGTVEISVTDQGIGIAERDLERVFERFYRADQARSRATGGTGLGLAIVKHVATNHGGVVRVWSAEGAGSTFTLELPMLPGFDPRHDPDAGPRWPLPAAPAQEVRP